LIAAACLIIYKYTSHFCKDLAWCFLRIIGVDTLYIEAEHNFQKSVDELDRFEQMKDFLKRAEQFGKEMDAMDDKKAFSEYSQKIMKLVDEMDNTPAAVNEIRQTGLQSSISSGLQAPGTFTPNKALFQ